MIDFENKKYLKLKQDTSYGSKVEELIVPGEEIIDSYKSVRDGLVFTTKRLIVVNIQGKFGKKVDYTSLPYSKFSSYSVETAGHFDLDAELQIMISGVGVLTFEFKGKSDIKAISRHISQAII